MLRIQKSTIVLDVIITSNGVLINQVQHRLPDSKVNRTQINYLTKTLELIAQHQIAECKRDVARQVLAEYFIERGWMVSEPVPR